jgi:glycosyltransferase involved in cell wall biosynthesis
MKYLIIVPAFNEEPTIGAVIDHIRQSASFADILVVNDGSTDGTRRKALERQVMVIDHPFNLGYGTALQTGFRFADDKGYDFVVTMDADGQHVSSSIGSLIETMNTQDADVVIGSRFLDGEYRIGIAKKIGIWLFSLIGKIYTGIGITDPTSGFQLLKRRVFSHLARGDNYPLDYPDVNIIMALHQMQFKVVEAPVQMVNDMSGKSMHSGLKPMGYVIRMFLAILMVCARGKGR